MALKLNNHRMRTTPLLFFYLLLCCQSTESLINKRVTLGGSVMLDCDIDIKDVYWFFLKPPESLVMILHTFTPDATSALFIDQRLRNKYSSHTYSRLVISDITKDEMGIYYCARIYSPALKLGSGTKLYISEPPPQDENQCNHQPNLQTTTHPILTVIYIPMMFAAIIVLNIRFNLELLLQIKLKMCKKSSKKCQDDKLKQLNTPNAYEFTEVEFRLCE